MDHMISSEKKQTVVASLQTQKNDTGSPVVQVGILTERIKELTEHLKVNKKDFAARRGLLQMVGKRKRHLQYIASKDSQKYLDLIKKLGLRR
jgi:small subunit ribosomal protein S15